MTFSNVLSIQLLHVIFIFLLNCILIFLIFVFSSFVSGGKVVILSMAEVKIHMIQIELLAVQAVVKDVYWYVKIQFIQEFLLEFIEY